MIALRDYQARGIAELRAAYARGSRRVIFVSPTGSGKSRCAAAIVEGAVARGKRVLLLAPRVEILGQLAREIAAAGIPTRTIQAQNDEGPTDAPVVVASVWTLTGEQWRDRLPPADLIVVDECHRVLAESYVKLIAQYPEARVLGLTATPSRGDGRGLGDAFDAIVVGSTVAELTARGFLVPCRVLVPNGAKADALALPVVHAYAEHCHGERAIVFAASIEHARSITADFEGVAELVTGKTPDEDRAAALARFASGETRALVNVNCFVEGLDVPETSAVIMARKFTHVGGYLQAIGRALRPAPGKERAIVVDLMGSALEHGPPDMERTYSLDGEAIRSKAKRDPIVQCRRCGAVYGRGPAACPHCGFAAPAMERGPLRSDGRGVVDLADVPPQPRRPCVAKFPGRCRECRRQFWAGAMIEWGAGSGAVHQACAARRQAA